ncbi:TetR/AcrR family transcriptional regulator [Paenibacillus paeoniae]|uniref:TetR/AcrR family transcriptional regulator n=1 Tax=Paenibacillus paeoniae TaxID=2292705 RepID=UPI001F0C35A6|nr:TetR/AcrR family transcriptional regulator [Paenibacillus paeoniae]
MSDIVEQAGVSQGTFYWHFKSKQEIALEIIRAGREGLLAVINQGYPTEGRSVEEMVRRSQRLLKNIFEFAAENRYFMELLLTESGAEDVIRVAIRETRIDMQTAFRSNIKRAVELDMLPNTIDLDMRSAFLVSLLEGVIARWLIGPVVDESKLQQLSPEELAAETVRFEFFGLLGI